MDRLRYILDYMHGHQEFNSNLISTFDRIETRSSKSKARFHQQLRKIIKNKNKTSKPFFRKNNIKTFPLLKSKTNFDAKQTKHEEGTFGNGTY